MGADWVKKNLNIFLKTLILVLIILLIIIFTGHHEINKNKIKSDFTNFFHFRSIYYFLNFYI